MAAFLAQRIAASVSVIKPEFRRNFSCSAIAAAPNIVATMNPNRGRLRSTLFGCVAAVAIASLTDPAHAAGPPPQAPDAGNPPHAWPHVFPLLGKAAAARGIKMQLPFGVGLNYAFADQAIDITKIAVGVNGSEPVDLSDVIVFDDLRSQVHAMNVRADMWLFPFLNLYALGNYVIESTTSVSIAEPFSFDAGAKQPGAGGGFGGTVAGGLWGFFGTLDMNWTWNKMQNLDAPVATYLLTPRVGRNFGKVGGVELIFWAGAMRQSIASDTKGEIRLSDAIGGDADTSGFKQRVMDWYEGLPPARQAVVSGIVDAIEGGDRDTVIQYELDKAIADPWNMLLGTEVGLTPAWRLRAEVGFINRTQVVVGVNYRFGDGAASPEVQP